MYGVNRKEKKNTNIILSLYITFYVTYIYFHIHNGNSRISFHNNGNIFEDLFAKLQFHIS